MRIYLALTLAVWLGIQSLVAASSRTPVPEAAAPDSALAATADSFRFVSWGDAQDENGNLSNTAAQAAALNPAFTLFNGDLENDGVLADRMNTMTAAFGSLYPKTFLVRGNHDDHVSGSAGLWENYFTASNRSLPTGVTNYMGMNSSSTYLTYSFDYGNSRFIGMDVPGDPDLLTSSQFTFLDDRLTDAENLGLTHAFIYFHGPEYCVESTHCNCSSANDGSCTPAAFVNVINKHPIVSATFHGHEHILGWAHMDRSRVAGLTGSYEEFLTSPSGGGTYNQYVYPDRMDYYYPDMGSSQGFAAIDVNGASFTINLYKVGTTAPVWSKTFTKPGVTSPVPTATRRRQPGQNHIFLPLISRNVHLAAATPMPTITRAPTRTATRVVTTPPASGTRPLKYYMADRVVNYADFAKLASWGINTAMVNIYTNGTTAQWQSVYNAASAAGVSIVVWPNIGQDNNCGWESPFNDPVNGSYIESSKNLLNFWKDKAIGIVTFHEPMWSTSAGCKDSIADLSQIYSQIHDYTGNPNFKVWGYINTLNTSTIRNGDGGSTGVADYTGPADLSKILDVAVIWQHCAGGVEGPCEGSYSALSRINEARTLLNSVNSPVASVYIMQTFTSGGYDTKFTLDQLENYSCEFLNTNALDGFGFYTWDASWWPDLHDWADLQPAVPYIYNTCAQRAP